ncbi:MAG: 2,3-bisphosphoglycerate-independent phosphoglycerate mutase [Ferruginibacter sp.]
MDVKKVILVIMDGWGLGRVPSSDAILQADTPFVDSLYKTYPNNILITCGEAVGLPAGQMGNSEVGHLNIGAGRIVYQDLQRINNEIKTGRFHKNPALLKAIYSAKSNNKFLHLAGLVSSGGVHSHIDHLKSILDVCFEEGCVNVLVHVFTDGRDTDPKSGLFYIKDLQAHIEKTTGSIATITGRYYAMDRDNRWERIKVAYEAMVNSTGNAVSDFPTAISESYQANVTDEFIKPMINARLTKTNIEAEDVVIFFNFRTDRCRELTEVLTQEDKPSFGMHKLDLIFYTMTVYDHTFKNIEPFYVKDDLNNTLGEVLSKKGRQQLRIAETEKYPHVSFFFSGGREVPFEGEQRTMIPSPKVATYDLKPEMSAPDLSANVVNEINDQTFDFICLNFANADMVGHTGVWIAVINAVETVDKCVASVVDAALKNNYAVFLTADHGNADYEINADGTPNTAHTVNPVPFFIIDNTFRGAIKNGKLGDIAPTILKFMGLEIPPEMTGDVLI